MKALIVFLIYVTTGFAIFFLLSLFGLPWNSYKEIIHNEGWGFCYTMFIGLWIGILPARSYYKKYEEEIDSYM